MQTCIVEQNMARCFRMGFRTCWYINTKLYHIVVNFQNWNQVINTRKRKPSVYLYTDTDTRIENFGQVAPEWATEGDGA